MHIYVMLHLIRRNDENLKKLKYIKLMTIKCSIKTLTLRRLMSYIYGAPILDVSRSHTTTQHGR